MTTRPRRRSLLLGAAVTPLALAVPAGLSLPAAADGTDRFAALRTRWVSLLTGGDLPDDPRLAGALYRLDKEADEHLADFSPIAPLWPDLAFEGEAAAVSEALGRMRTIALARATPGSAIHADPEVGEHLAAALSVIAEDGYRPGLSPSGNWWFWEIGVPNQLTDVVALAHDAVPSPVRTALMDAIAHFSPDPGFRGRGTSLVETGANRVDKSLRCALRGVLRESEEDLVLARDALSDLAGGGAASVFGYVTGGDGFYEDGSFVQHGKLPYVGTYGTVALGGIAQVLALLADTDWAVTDPAHTMIVDAVERTFAPFIWHGVMMDTVRGRAVSRQEDTGAGNALSAAHAALLLTEVAPVRDRDRLVGRALGWIDAAPVDVAEEAGVAQIARWIAAEDGTEPLRDLPGLQVFADQDRFTHRREGWAFTVSTSSSRIGRFEWGNRENATGWYQGDGATYLQLASDPEQTGIDYWPTVDPYRLPGTTVEMTDRKPGLADGTGIPGASAAWAGGTSVLGTVGAWGMDHVSHDGSLRARLSWFLLEDTVVALGAGITGTSGAEVETTVENRALRHGSPTVTVEGDGRSDAPQWAHLEGVGGYAVLDGAGLRVTDQKRHGAWSDINQGADTSGYDEVRTVRYATLTIPHGIDPESASYAYALLPGRTVAGTRRAARDLAIGRQAMILSNTAALQALSTARRHGTLLFANAFEAAEATEIAADGPASIAVAETARGAHVSVSDPSRTAETVTVTLPRIRAGRIVNADDSVEVTSRAPLTVTVAVGGSRGHTHRVELRV